MHANGKSSKLLKSKLVESLNVSGRYFCSSSADQGLPLVEMVNQGSTPDGGHRCDSVVRLGIARAVVLVGAGIGRLRAAPDVFPVVTWQRKNRLMKGTEVGVGGLIAEQGGDRGQTRYGHSLFPSPVTAAMEHQSQGQGQSQTE